MTKAETIRFLHSERCSPIEIGLAVDESPREIKAMLGDREFMIGYMIAAAFNSWGSVRIEDKVVSL